MQDHYDVIAIGSGGGMKLALPAAARGLRVALVERGAMGGTCLNRGCIPSKMLIYPTETAERMRRAARLNVHLSEAPHVDWATLVRRTSHAVDEISRGLAARWAGRPGLDLLRESARFVGGRTLELGGRRITGDRIFIATGSVPAIPDIPGLADTPYMTSEDALRRTELPRRLIVIGAGYIATELGGAYGAAGADVTFIVRSKLLRREDDEIAGEFARVFSERHTILQAVHPVQVAHDGGRFTVTVRDTVGADTEVEGDALLVATGVTPVTADLGLENTHVETDTDDFIAVDDHLATAEPGVYALGDVLGRYLFRHTVNFEGEYLARTALAAGPQPPIDYGPVPHAVFGHPEAAGVGMTEQEAIAAGLDYVVGRATYADSTPGMARASDHGLAKILVARDDRRLLGAHIVGDEASNMVHLFIATMKLRGTLDDLLDMIFIHPALPEVARDACRDARDRLASGN